jgi:hypothetical protein
MSSASRVNTRGSSKSDATKKADAIPPYILLFLWWLYSTGNKRRHSEILIAERISMSLLFSYEWDWSKGLGC